MVILSDKESSWDDMCRRLPITHLKIQDYLDEDLFNDQGERMITLVEIQDALFCIDLINGYPSRDCSRLLEGMRNYDTVRITFPEYFWYFGETVRALRRLTKARIYRQSINGYSNNLLEERYCELDAASPSPSPASIASLDDSPYRFKFNEYATCHVFDHMNALKDECFYYLMKLTLRFANHEERPVISGIYAPRLIRLIVEYGGQFPLFQNNDFGSLASEDRGIQTVLLVPSFSIMPLDDIYWGPTKPRAQSRLMSPKEMEMCDFSWTRFFKLITVHGGPDDLIRLMNFEKTETFIWRRSCFQHPESQPILSLTTPKLLEFIHEDLLPSPSVPALIGATALKAVMVGAHQSGLRLNGLLRDKKLS